MKKQFLSIALIAFLSFTSFAQLEKGSWIGGVSGSVDFSFRKSSSNRAFFCSLNPYAMYLVSNNFAVGLNLDYSYNFSKYNYTSQTGSELIKYSTNTIMFAPVVRKYFGNSRYRPYLGITTGLAIHQTNSFVPTSPDVSKSTNFGYFLSPEAGISYWLNDKVFFDVKASYDLINYNLNGAYHAVDLKIGVGIKIGKSTPKK
jgi:hypothetical protein